MDNQTPLNNQPPLPAQPSNQPGPTPIPGGNPIDISSVLLPKKDIHPDSAQRVVAGEVLNDQAAAIAAREVPRQPTPIQRVYPAAPPTPEQANSTSPLQTYQEDIQTAVGDQHVSVVSIAAAEAARRSRSPLESAPAGPRFTLRNVIYIGLGLVLIGIASGTLAYIMFKPTTVPVATTATAPFIAVDGSKNIPVSTTMSRTALMSALVSARDSSNLSLGLVERILPIEASTTQSGAPVQLSSSAFLTLIAPLVPDALVRSLYPNFLLGVHSFSQSQPFMILRVDSYQQGFSGMLAWEVTLQQDLAPLFPYTQPQPRATPAQTEGTTTASTTPVTTADQVVVPPTFSDQVVENHDARVMRGAQGDITLLWTFLDQQTIVITTSPSTLREVIKRLSVAPFQSIPL
ncbi:MAG: protein of unknown function with transrane region [Candidatus Adlerbacteria bacterium]|nr:protein of unknown function with transrane region [Candidatus Adlerbacteria bacterium]